MSSPGYQPRCARSANRSADARRPSPQRQARAGRDGRNGKAFGRPGDVDVLPPQSHQPGQPLTFALWRVADSRDLRGDVGVEHRLHARLIELVERAAFAEPPRELRCCLGGGLRLGKKIRDFCCGDGAVIAAPRLRRETQSFFRGRKLACRKRSAAISARAGSVAAQECSRQCVFRSRSPPARTAVRSKSRDWAAGSRRSCALPRYRADCKPPVARDCSGVRPAQPHPPSAVSRAAAAHRHRPQPRHSRCGSRRRPCAASRGQFRNRGHAAIGRERLAARKRQGRNNTRRMTAQRFTFHRAPLTRISVAA